MIQVQTVGHGPRPGRHDAGRCFEGYLESYVRTSDSGEHFRVVPHAAS
jgi:hypothetical protein